MIIGGRALFGRGASRVTEFRQTPNANQFNLGVRTWVIRSVFERETARPPAKVPKYMLSGKGCGVAQTTRMLA